MRLKSARINKIENGRHDAIFTKIMHDYHKYYLKREKNFFKFYKKLLSKL
jgi:hypothetical protein